MNEKSKRGNGSSFMYIISHSFNNSRSPFINYVNHVSKVTNCKTAINTHQGDQIDNFKEKLDLQRLKDHQRK